MMNLMKHFLATALILVVSQPLFAQECSWTFARHKMILDFQKETSAVPHSAYLIGLQIDQKNLKKTIEEISGERKLDSQGCIAGRCKAADKARFRTYLTRNVSALGVPTYLEWERNEIMSGLRLNANPDLGPLNFKRITPEFAVKLTQARSLNSVFNFLKAAKFNFGEDSFRSINVDFVEELIADLQIQQPKKKPVGPNFESTWGDLSKSAFLKNSLLNERLLRELSALKDRLYAGEIEQNLARGRNKELLNTPEVVNVIAEIKGSKFPDEIFEVSAHYDTVPRAPGADDNGSGVSAMLEMIRIFQMFPPQRTIRFVFTDLEENGKYGSILHAKNVLARKDKLLAALVLDTIGYHPEREDKNNIPVYVLELGTPSMHTNRISFEQARRLTETIAWQSNRYYRGVRYSVETKGALPGTGDHGSYLEAGLPAVFAAAGFEGDLINPGYHMPTDKIKSYNWPFFMDITRALTESVAVITGAHVSISDYKRIPRQLLNEMDAAVDPEGAQRKLLRNIPSKGIPKEKASEETFVPGPSDPKSEKSLFEYFMNLMLGIGG